MLSCSTLWGGLLCTLLTAAPAPKRSPAPDSRAWAKALRPSAQTPAALGGYSRGCVAGAKALPLRGDNHLVMRPSRRRNFGHPELISVVKSLAASMKAHGLGRLAVGDLGQARGGPAPSGHKSHQSGLDVDLWFVTPRSLNRKVLPRKLKLETLGAQDLVTKDQSAVRPQMNARVMSMLHLAADDPRVARIFVHPRIKEALCKRAGKSRAWLRKIRPWWGHRSHFHMRLQCPRSDRLCENQSALPPGDGCEGLEWWFDAKAQAERKKGRAQYRKNMGKAPTMPQQCHEVLRASPSKG